ncbi:MAG: ornithine cyclodeaminase family protein [Candidatus Bathyarchaeia archaeon]
MTLYLTQKDVESVLDMKGAIEAVEDGFREMGLGRVEMPARVYLHFEEYNGVLIAMPAYIMGLDAAGLKVVTVHPGNPERYGLPAVIATIILNDPKNGKPLAIMDGTYITALRTGAAGACGAKYLSRRDSKVVGIIGLGVQGRSQLMGLCEVRDIEKAKVFDLLPAARSKYVEEMGGRLGIDIEAVDSYEEAVRGVDIVVTCTPSPKPFLKGEWVEEGVHISAIGADTVAKRELDSSVVKKVDKLVVDFIDQALIVGDLAVPVSEGAIRREDIYAELGEIVAGKKRGREREEEITLFKATGLAIQDVGTAFKVYNLAKERGVGREL